MGQMPGRFKWPRAVLFITCLHGGNCLARQASERWPLLGLTIIHRFGMIAPGEPIVVVLAASAHRQAAFEAASFLMDYLKTRAPFWKKEHRSDGSTGDWVAAKETDETAARKWR